MIIYFMLKKSDNVKFDYTITDELEFMQDLLDYWWKKQKNLKAK